MKMAPVILELKRRGMTQMVVHTGQHYDAEMSDIFFNGLGIPQPDISLSVGSASHAEQTARVMVAFEKVCLERKPNLIVVGGDVNSTLACALVGAKLLIPVAHVEAGLRSFDRSMPEEVNRILTDHVASLLFTTERSGSQNLLHEGIPPDQVHFVGNSMIDSLRAHLEKALKHKPWTKFSLEPDHYGLVTLHRPSNVDEPAAFTEIATALKEISLAVPLVFPVHPRTRHRIEEFGIDLNPVQLIDPLSYNDFLGLMASSSLVLTDSGGVQEETTALGVPCVTIRPNTERPITVELGMNCLAGVKKSDIVKAARETLARKTRHPVLPPLWDGQAARRIVDVIERFLEPL
jgi:UDP-N-acetylglucosamine 2-epimerase (non-hydrolysing)